MFPSQHPHTFSTITSTIPTKKWLDLNNSNHAIFIYYFSSNSINKSPVEIGSPSAT